MPKSPGARATEPAVIEAVHEPAEGGISANESALTGGTTAPEASPDPSTDGGRPPRLDPGVPASEVAWIIAELVPVLSEQTIADLGRLLNRSLTAISAAELREARLGLLVDLVADAKGTVPSLDEYNCARQARQTLGETWPAHTTLIRAYGGHWLTAVKAAMRLACDGAVARVPTSTQYKHRHHRAYTRDEVATAIKQCWLELGLDPHGGGPNANEYLEWSKLRRELARLSGQPDPRLPSQVVILKNFGAYDRAVERARALLDGAA